MLIPLFWDYPAGLKRYKRMWIYTSTGTGFWGPPNRFLKPKELTLLVLKKT
jgi:predicted MPP superfamily phosphohydrolase